jgi:hypothetical protein
MGMDFFALLKSEWMGERSLRVVDAIESDSPVELKQVRVLWKECDFADMDLSKAEWIEAYGSGAIISRPELPNLKASLHTPEDFFITFGQDSIGIYHILRWRSFLVDPRWQSTMLQACHVLSHMFSATEGIITNDESPVIAAFLNGATFDDALAAGQGEYGEVKNLNDLYFENEDIWNSTGYWRFLKKKDA